MLTSPADPALNSFWGGGDYPEVELLDNTVALVLIFGGTLVLFSVRTAPIHTHSTVQKPLLSHTLSTLAFLIIAILTEARRQHVGLN